MTDAWVQSAPLQTTAGHRGIIAVTYLEEKPPETEGPFLAEERDLINSLADSVSSYLNRKQAETALRQTHERMQALSQRLMHERVGVGIENMELVQIAGGIIEILGVGHIDKSGEPQAQRFPNARGINLLFQRIETFEDARRRCTRGGRVLGMDDPGRCKRECATQRQGRSDQDGIPFH